MNRADLLKTIELLTAISQAKTLQHCRRDGDWVDVVDVSPSQVMVCPHTYRVKPEPKYRMWKLGDIPIGAVIRRNDTPTPRIPQVIIAAGIYEGVQGNLAFAILHLEHSRNTRADKLLPGWEWKWAHEPEQSWRVCGIPVAEA